jgi:phosphoribosyl-ATP pyrophosphohydrolase
LILLAYHDIAPEEIYAELRRRSGTSGIAEKASRTACHKAIPEE